MQNDECALKAAQQIRKELLEAILQASQSFTHSKGFEGPEVSGFNEYAVQNYAYGLVSLSSTLTNDFKHAHAIADYLQAKEEEEYSSDMYYQYTAFLDEPDEESRKLERFRDYREELAESLRVAYESAMDHFLCRFEASKEVTSWEDLEV